MNTIFVLAFSVLAVISATRMQPQSSGKAAPRNLLYLWLGGGLKEGEAADHEEPPTKRHRGHVFTPEELRAKFLSLGETKAVFDHTDLRACEKTCECFKQWLRDEIERECKENIKGKL